MALKRDLLTVVGGRLLAVLIALVTIRAVTTFLSPERYGELALLITVQMFCGLLFINPVGQHINLNTHLWWDDKTLVRRLKSFRSYILAISLLGGIIAFITCKILSIQGGIWSALAVFAIVFLGTWNATLVPMLNMLGFRGKSVVWSLLTVVAGLLSSILFVQWSPTAHAWLGGQSIGMAIGALGARSVLLRHSGQAAKSQSGLPLLQMTTLWTYCLPLAFATGLMWIQLSGYRFVVETFWGLAQLGFLALGVQLAGQIWALAESLAMQFFIPMFYRRISDVGKSLEIETAFSDLLNTLVPVYLVLTGLIVLSARYLLKILVSPQFWDALLFVIIGAGIELCRVLGNLFSNAAHARRRTRSLTVPYGVGALTTLSLLILAGLNGIDIKWAGAGILAGAVAMLVVMVIIMNWQLRITIDRWRWFAGLLAMSAMLLITVWMPDVTGMAAAIELLTVAATMAALVMLGLLWRNPATIRLLKVQLRN